MTVRSCDTHNHEKSADDEFLMATLAPILGNNSVGYIHTKTKLGRALTRNSSGLVRAAYGDDTEEHALCSPEGATFPLLKVKTDNHRLLRCFEGIARGIFRLEYGERFVGRCQVFPEFLEYDTSPKLEFYKRILQILDSQELSSIEAVGTNPEVFTYQPGVTDQYGLTPLVMTFYGQSRVFVAYCPEGVTPPHAQLPNKAS